MQFDTSKYRVYNWKHFAMLHWMLNPGLAINELILGQRIPKIMFEDKKSDKPRYERSLIPCPHCDTLHDGRTWSTQNRTGFKNWFGLYCPTCGGIIPCLRNFTSFILLAVTFPLWGWFRNSLKRQWLAKQPQRFVTVDLDKMPDPSAGKGWIAQGIIWASIMFLLMEVLTPLFLFEEEITARRLLIGAAVWAVGGLFFGYLNKQFLQYKERDKAQHR